MAVGHGAQAGEQVEAGAQAGTVRELVSSDSRQVMGLVENPIALTLEQFMALPQQDSVSDMHCVTQWSRYDNAWRGVAARTLLEMVEPYDSARHVIFHAHDGYTTNVRLDQFDQPVAVSFVQTCLVPLQAEDVKSVRRLHGSQQWLDMEGIGHDG